MSSEEHCIDLLNAIQLAGDATSVKLSKLEQLREILLKRSPQLLTKIAPDVFAFMLEPSAKIRKFLLQFSGEVFQQDKTFVRIPKYSRFEKKLISQTFPPSPGRKFHYFTSLFQV